MNCYSLATVSGSAQHMLRFDQKQWYVNKAVNTQDEDLSSVLSVSGLHIIMLSGTGDEGQMYRGPVSTWWKRFICLDMAYIA